MINIKKSFNRIEFVTLMTILVLSIVIQIQSGLFFTANNLVDTLRSIVVPTMFAMGLLLCIVTGGIDVSFPSIAMLSSYSATVLAMEYGFKSALIVFIISTLLGLLMGLFNAILVNWLKLSAFIITIGTSSIFLGFMQGVLKSRSIPVLPQALFGIKDSVLFAVREGKMGLSSVMPTIALSMPVIVGLVYVISRYTMLGRGIYALGGDAVAAERIGFNIKGINLFVFSFMGAIAGYTGMVRVVMAGNLQHTSLIGYEMKIIAALILGGTRLSGGRGSVIGAILGVLLLMMVNNSLILLGIPTHWSRFVEGVLVVLGIIFSSYTEIRRRKRISMNLLAS